MQLKDLVDKIDEYDDAYYNKHTQIISDKEYDGLKDTLKHLTKSFSPSNKKEEKLLVRCNDALSRVGAPPPKDGKWEKVIHDTPMGSLNKVNTPDELKDWFKKCNDLYKKNNNTDISPYGGVFLSTEKLDGASVSLKYEKGQFVQGGSRGGGGVGENITRNVRRMKGVPLKLPVDFTGYVRGEIVLKRSDLDKFPDISSARNGASGIASRIDGVGVEHLSVIVYSVEGKDFNREFDQFDFLESVGFDVPNYHLLSTLDDVVKLWQKYMDETRDSLDYEIDGLVIRLDEMATQLSLGDENHRPKGQIAFKFEAPEAQTTVRDIIWQVGDTGRITPVAEFDPVFLLGAEIRRASLYNVSNVENLGVDIGAEVLISRRNDVIPACESVVKPVGTVAKAPNKCPACGAATIRSGEYLLCTNKQSCPEQVKGRINKWVGELNILEWGEAILKKLIASGLVSDVADIYKLKVEDIESLDRMGNKSAVNLITELDKFREISLENFLGGLCIEGIATSSVKLVIDSGYDSLDKIQKMTINEFENIAGFGVVKAEQFYNGLKENKNRIDDIIAAGVKIKGKIIGALTGKSFCITGSLSMPRAKMQAMIIDNGGSVKSSVGKGLSYLICEDPSGSSSKLQAARKNGTKLISEKEFLGLCDA